MRERELQGVYAAVDLWQYEIAEASHLNSVARDIGCILRCGVSRVAREPVAPSGREISCHVVEILKIGNRHSRCSRDGSGETGVAVATFLAENVRHKMEVDSRKNS